MLGTEGFVDIQVLRRQGMSIKGIARELGISRNTVRSYLRTDTAPVFKPNPSRSSKLDPFKDYLQLRVAAAHPDWIPATVLFDELKARGFTGGITILRDHMVTLKPRRRADPLVRFETAPGQQMQVDWGAFRLGSVKVSAFVATLGFSRDTFGTFVEDEQFMTLRTCHEQAFDEFGGVPKEVLYDNMRTVVQARNAYGRGQHRFHPGLRDFAHHYGFMPRLCQPYRAKTKGKVERFIGYLRRSFFVPVVSRYQQLGEPLDLLLLNQELASWLEHTANRREHGTTGAVPADQLLIERQLLQPLPPRYVDGRPRQRATAHKPLRDHWPVEILQHPLSTYDALLEAV
ncbi:MAG: IS21 family transposase [Lysobacterales bacterium]